MSKQASVPGYFLIGEPVQRPDGSVLRLFSDPDYRVRVEIANRPVGIDHRTDSYTSPDVRDIGEGSWTIGVAHIGRAAYEGLAWVTSDQSESGVPETYDDCL